MATKIRIGSGRENSAGRSRVCSVIWPRRVRGDGGALEHHDGAGHGEVERVGAALLRDAGKRVGFPRQLLGQAGLLVAHQDDDGFLLVVDRPVVDRSGKMRGDDGNARVPLPCNEFFRGGAATGTAKTEPMVARTVSSENGSVVSPTRMTRKRRRVGRADDRAEIAGIADAVERYPRFALPGVNVPKRLPAAFEDADHHLRIVAPGDRGDHLLADFEHQSAGSDGLGGHLLDQRLSLAALA